LLNLGIDWVKYRLFGVELLLGE